MKNLIILVVASIFSTSCGTFSSDNNNKKNDTTMTTTKAIHLTKQQFIDQVANYEAEKGEFKYLGQKPCLIDFYASWCGPCKTLAPVLDELSHEYDGKIVIYKIDTEKEQELAAAFNIRSIPTLIFVPVGGQPQMVQGALPKAQLKEAIEEILLKP